MNLGPEHIEAVQAAAEKIHDAAVMLTKPHPVGGTVTQVVMPPPTEGERAVHRVEKYFVAMVVLNVCFGAAMVLNWITDKNQDYVINAIYMMAPGLQKQIEAKKESAKP